MLGRKLHFPFITKLNFSGKKCLEQFAKFDVLKKPFFSTHGIKCWQRFLLKLKLQILQKAISLDHQHIEINNNTE